jgi:large subunit ribosomal protein L4
VYNVVCHRMDIMPRNIAVATSHFKYYSLMPVYGLNVFSILKHDTLVLTRAAVDEIEKHLLERLHACDFRPRPTSPLLS